MRVDYFDARSTIKIGNQEFGLFRLDKLEALGHARLDRLPFSIRVMLEAVLRNLNGKEVVQQDVLNLAAWKPVEATRRAMPFYPGRVVMQDFTGVPVINDLAAMRAAMVRLSGDPHLINPVIPVDLVIDHSVQVDHYGSTDALLRNAEIEFHRNRERYEFLHWAQKAFNNFRVVPPATGIVHQVNLEYLSKVVLTREEEGQSIAFPDTVVGTDSHTTMINGLGVVGWGVGGIEAISAMLGQPIDMLIPDVIGVRLSGKLPEGTTPTDLTLTITQMLRKKGVVNKFVEFFGPGLTFLPLAVRAMISNMSPENGATITFFPVDNQTLQYLRLTGRDEKLVKLVEVYCQEQRLFRTDESPDPEYTDILEVDLNTVESSLAGPRRPQDRVSLKQMKSSFQQALQKPKTEGGYAISSAELDRKAKLTIEGSTVEMGHGAAVIAAITSCTNTSDPFVMVGAGLLAKKAVEKGLEKKSYVKTSLAPGSRVVTDYLVKANLMEPLADLGFDLVGYGCTTCIGNSGPLPTEVANAIREQNLVAAAVLSGNRNFEGRIHPFALANYLASPPMVVAYALAGRVDIDLTREPIGEAKDGSPVFLADIWPSNQEIMDTIRENITPDMFEANYSQIFISNGIWNQIDSGNDLLYSWDSDSTYIQEPPFFIGLSSFRRKGNDIHGARTLALLGDTVTTDHISPAGSIPASGAAGKYLLEHGVEIHEFNSFGSRRGNDRVMTRGTFGNIRLKNRLVPGVEGSFTLHFPDKTQMSIYDAAMRYKEEGVPLIVIAGKEYGTGSSRDWAAKGTLLLGVMAVIAESYERIHRSNLAGMGVLPLQFKPGENAEILGLTGHEVYFIEGIQDAMHPGSVLTVRAIKEDGEEFTFQTIVRLDTPIEVEYYRNGGIMQTVLANLLASSMQVA
jgi:aconitate hydratase